MLVTAPYFLITYLYARNQEPILDLGENKHLFYKNDGSIDWKMIAYCGLASLFTLTIFFTISFTF